MKPLLIIIFALILLGGGGAGAYFYFAKPAQAAVDASGEIAHAPKEAKKKGHGKAVESKFVELDPLILPVVTKNGVSQVLSMVIVLEVPNEEAMKNAEHLAPRLKDAFIQDMYGVLSHEAVMNSGVLQVGPLKNRLTRVSHKVLGEEGVNDVLIQVIQQRSM
ncbi:flagellar basal body-associated FliL family protein [Micavibrio aeruginosavorus]|uniref:Flagellar basal body-associated FliL family protein n=1 Tax=Micavibrio aeruginosavorus (strain ARL-13) TaxID=856793 RepID=G2KLU3_MICAA|nr:flagellar basal body-associated FliL family protein [Micavibrio aeruginosavorus]AEP09322.1 flagellar basal body-associated FliL family protein [Micavibrio aeruginosavorus ARL-13]